MSGKERNVAELAEKFWMFVLFAVGVLITSFICYFGEAQPIKVLSTVAAQVNAVVLYTLVVYGQQYFTLGGSFDVNDEIYVQNNQAAAIYQGLTNIGIAMVISRALLG